MPPAQSRGDASHTTVAEEAQILEQRAADPAALPPETARPPGIMNCTIICLYGSYANDSLQVPNSIKRLIHESDHIVNR